MTITPPLMELRNVSRDFLIKAGLFGQKKILRAVRSVSIDIEKGDVLALVGESGCGKTTLARMLMNVLEPTSGDILYQGKPNKDRSAADRSRKLQAVFQDPYSSLDPRFTVADVLTEPYTVQGAALPATRIPDLLDQVGLSRSMAARSTFCPLGAGSGRGITVAPRACRPGARLPSVCPL